MHKELQRVIRFLIVGVSNVAIDVGVFNILLLVGLNAYWASSLSYILAATNSFVHNRRWTFHDGQRNAYVQYVQFMLANAIGLVFNNGLVYLFARYVDLGNEMLENNAAKILAAGLIVIWNYGVSRLMIFRPHKQAD